MKWLMILKHRFVSQLLEIARSQWEADRVGRKSCVVKVPFRLGAVFFTVQFSHPYMTTGKTVTWTIRTIVSKVMSLLLNTLSRFVIAFLPRSKHLLISWLQLPYIFGKQQHGGNFQHHLFCNQIKSQLMSDRRRVDFRPKGTHFCYRNNHSPLYPIGKEYSQHHQDVCFNKECKRIEYIKQKSSEAFTVKL